MTSERPLSSVNEPEIEYDSFFEEYIDQSLTDLHRVGGELIYGSPLLSIMSGESDAQKSMDYASRIIPTEALQEFFLIATDVTAIIQDEEILKDLKLHNTRATSVLVSMMVAAECANKNNEELKQLRERSLKSIILDIREPEYLHGTKFDTYVMQMVWDLHMAYGSTVLLNEDNDDQEGISKKAWDKYSPHRHISENHGESMALRLFIDKLKGDITFEEKRKMAKYLTEGLDEDAEIPAKYYFSALAADILSTEVQRAARIGQDSGTTWHEFVQAVDALDENELFEDEAVVDLDYFKPTELDWEILPPGKLQEFAQEIEAGESRRHANREAIIDPNRLLTLEKIRSEWGADRSYYAKGALRQRRTVRGNNARCPDQYIILVLQELANDGTLIEHAIAESPIAGPHAMYLYRQDIGSDISWRDVMSLDKKDARKLGARPIKHLANLEADSLVNRMTDRAVTLLTSTPEEFLRIEFNGNNFRVAKHLAIKAFDSLNVPR